MLLFALGQHSFDFLDLIGLVGSDLGDSLPQRMVLSCRTLGVFFDTLNVIMAIWVPVQPVWVHAVALVRLVNIGDGREAYWRAIKELRLATLNLLYQVLIARVVPQEHRVEDMVPLVDLVLLMLATLLYFDTFTTGASANRFFPRRLIGLCKVCLLTLQEKRDSFLFRNFELLERHSWHVFKRLWALLLLVRFLCGSSSCATGLLLIHFRIQNWSNL